MSAIAGIYHLNDEPINLEHGRRIMKALEKFPADDIQTWHNDKVFLGCHAQWITPESIGEKLPYYDYERQLAITADAIIDNRDELFDRLQVDRGRRKVITDSELILLAYYKWGEETPKFLVGDFAFMIWDEKKGKLFGARDFSGSRTLYYFFNGQKMAFCTAIKPLLSLPYIEKKLNENWLAEFLAIPVNFESVDPSTTIYQNIEQVPPSHSISIVNNRMSISRYSTLTDGVKINLKSDQEYEEAFRDVFGAAVKSRIRTYHNVGAHLSGGLDSGSVASFAAKELKKENKKLHTFSYVPVDDFIDFTHKSRIANEKSYIKSTVEFVGNINDQYLSFEEKNPFTEINEWLDIHEMPYKFFENTFWLKGIYEQAHSQGIGVLLNGQRGNWTISWGPVLDYYAVLLKKMNWIRLFHELSLYSKNISVKKSRIMTEVRKKAFPAVYKLINTNDHFHFPMIINPEFAEKTHVLENLQEHGIDISASEFPSAYEVRKRQFEKLYYWNTTGTYGSKLSLRYSLLDRDPTNDLRVINFCLSVPEHQFVRNGLDRSLVRRATKDYLPDKVRLNLRTRGVQGADGVHRMTKYWDDFINELEQLSADSLIGEFLNLKVIKEAISKLGREAKPEYAFDFDFRILMRFLIVSRFIKTF
ncbi:lasso peptide isopeptide bond-forming cyclase [Bacillus sp. EB600]|uniref:lasso peptide isopeptide bond-forming cyclase n=1 Tax=Bacillus sp. EB600 TaxID=2806345 RepID=UPI002108E192|nr:lasso peptide isopeptide bond-forming cyclase [Bacillus sp. EB600]MCQ6278913.1 lasso peptide isopeptide bond-forming cyclase [Bacillus sp. EB600]